MLCGAQNLKGQVMDEFDYHLLSYFVILARKQKSDIEYVLSELMKLLSEDRYVSKLTCLLLLSVCLSH